MSNASAEIKLRKVNLGFAAEIFYNSDTAGAKLCILPIAHGRNADYSEIIFSNVSVPVLLSIGRQTLTEEIEVDVIRVHKRTTANEIYALGYYKLREGFAVIERVSSDIGHAVGNFNVCKSLAILECKVVNLLKLCIFEINGFQSSYAVKGMRLNMLNCASFLEYNGLQTITTGKRVCTERLDLTAFCKGNPI